MTQRNHSNSQSRSFKAITAITSNDRDFQATSLLTKLANCLGKRRMQAIFASSSCTFLWSRSLEIGLLENWQKHQKPLSSCFFMFLPQCPLVSCLPIESATRAWPVSASAQNGLIDLRLGCSPLYEPLARSGCCLWVKMSGVSKSSDGHETLQQSLVINLQHLATQYLGLVKATWVLAQLQQKQDKHWLFRRTSLDETFEQGLDAVLPKLAASRFANFAIWLKSHDFILQEYSHGIFRCLQGLGLLVCKAPEDNQQRQALAEVKDRKDS